ncbi:MAG: ATP-binding protein [Opitutaceae bacterium]|nr:ATP-binding protein [Opitutaceae bacterium]
MDSYNVYFTCIQNENETFHDPRISIRTQLCAEPRLLPTCATVVIGIEDQGIGIATEELAQVFEIFTRTAGKDKRRGSGIGLAIVRKGVERMGGKVGVESELHIGSRFWVALPAA